MTALPRYLGLDLGVRTGWALAEGDRFIDSGVRDFSVKKSVHVGRRGWSFFNFLMSIGKVDEIYFEKIQFGGGGYKGEDGKWHGAPTNDGRQFYHGLLMILDMYASNFGCPIIPEWPGTLKKAFTGYGKAEKADMCAAAHAIGWQGGLKGTELSHDEADAIGLVHIKVRDQYGILVTFDGVLPAPALPAQPSLLDL